MGKNAKEVHWAEKFGVIPKLVVKFMLMVAFVALLPPLHAKTPRLKIAFFMW